MITENDDSSNVEYTCMTVQYNIIKIIQGQSHTTLQSDNISETMRYIETVTMDDKQEVVYRICHTLLGLERF